MCGRGEGRSSPPAFGRAIDGRPLYGIMPRFKTTGRARSSPTIGSLLSALPSVGGDRMRRRVVLQGDPPTPIDPPPGCPFAGRCPKAEARCHREKPTLAVQGDMPDHSVACHYPEPS